MSEMAGPGQMPDMPQPTPKRAEPMTSGASMRLNSGWWNCTSNSGFCRTRPMRIAANVTMSAATITKARLGSHSPVAMPVKSRNRRTFSGSVICEM